jgi:hypothetical protein
MKSLDYFLCAAFYAIACAFGMPSPEHLAIKCWLDWFKLAYDLQQLLWPEAEVARLSPSSATPLENATLVKGVLDRGNGAGVRSLQFMSRKSF